MLPELDAILQIQGLIARPEFPLSRITTWGTGGPSLLVEATTDESLIRLLEIARATESEIVVLGNCSDVLVSDNGVDGICLRLAGDHSRVEADGTDLLAGAGAALATVSNVAAASGLSGVEFLSGIPGTAGGAVATNAGSFSSTTAGVLASVQALDREGKTVSLFGFEDRYRESLVAPGLVITNARFALAHAGRDAVESETARVRELRRSKQPLGARTAGSVFKNPTGDSAGRLIDSCGLKGTAVGGARVSTEHANFIVNEGKATSGDILALMRLVRDRVAVEFGVTLETEVRLVGFEREAF